MELLADADTDADAEWLLQAAPGDEVVRREPVYESREERRSQRPCLYWYLHPGPASCRHAWPHVCGNMLRKLRCHNTLPYGQLFRLATSITPASASESA